MFGKTHSKISKILCVTLLQVQYPNLVLFLIYCANQKGKTCYTNFISERLGKERKTKFFDKIPQVKLKTFGKQKAKLAKLVCNDAYNFTKP